MNRILIGAQWGDEGKGKVIDVLSKKSDVIVRFQGGNNAGHTVKFAKEKFVLHLIPSGILHPGKVCVIGNGVVIDPEAFFEEVDMLESRGIKVAGRLFVSETAHILFPYHKLIDQLKEDSFKAEDKIGTTKKGIGPCYADKISRIGLRAGDLKDLPYFRERLKKVLNEKNAEIKKIYKHKGLSFDSVFNRCKRYRSRFLKYCLDTPTYLYEASKKKKSILFEGAQGTMLDIDHGTYPFVTSSNASVGGAITGAGISPTLINQVMGVAKAYTTRVGEGPFPTVFPAKLMRVIQEKGAEFGSTTGRPRRCGWFDGVVAKHAVRINGISEMAIMKLDVLSGLDEIKIAVAYKLSGKTVKTCPLSANDFSKCKPVYETMKGWKEDISDIRRFKDLPVNAKRYLKRIEKLIEVPIKLVSVGSKRAQTITL